MSSLVVMGVSGCGKSSVAAAVAKRLQRPLIEGDEFHPESNRAKMAAGVALTDADRAAWLDTLGRELAAHPAGAVLTCSALKRTYREALRAASPGLRFAWLDLDQAASLARVSQRGADHFFPPELVANQFHTLESPAGEPGVLRLDALLALPVLSDQVCAWMRSPT
jgi:gluconokinase